MAAELFLVAIAPSTGRLVEHHRRRFRKALASLVGTRGPGRSRRARRRAVRELRAAGIVARSGIPGRYPLVAGPGARQTTARLRRGIEHGFRDERDRDLVLILAWTGVLARRLSRSEREHARKRLRAVIEATRSDIRQEHEIEPTARAIGEVIYRQEREVVQDLLHDLLFDDPISVDGLSGDHGDGGHGSASGGDGQ